MVAIEFQEAMEAIIEGFRDEQVREEEERRSHAALKRWRHFIMSLRIKKRIDGYEVDGEENPNVYTPEQEDVVDEGAESEEDYGGGGFFPE